MGRNWEHLAMKTDDWTAADFTGNGGGADDQLKVAAQTLINSAATLGSLAFGTSFLKWVASIAAMGEVGKWISFIAVVLRLFFPRHFPECLDMPVSLILLLVVAPSFFARTLKNSWVGVVICLLIGCYLLQEHIRASGGFRNSFTQRHGVSNTMGIILLLVYPVWTLIVDVI
ncbi:cold-regulated 413 plasma membrane protein 2-like isoform X2 [Punica granatum]|uniref:Cold-regulated 413 plasma membrane protein 2-like isoform X2 n=1 Tax=Punica granatum TaxID=22663 RepID=A0A218W2H9_PUNGR|nr:cold-regulated 413 plasma membrane protein 2-like isoform X2 [Punica granatum]OWM66322.1 hypothetical protein CDL15_Pgr013539 [Punica granatum]